MSIKDVLIEAFEALKQAFDNEELAGFIIVGVPSLDNPELEYSEVYLSPDSVTPLALAGLEMVKHRLLSMCTADVLRH